MIPPAVEQQIKVRLENLAVDHQRNKGQRRQAQRACEAFLRRKYGRVMKFLKRELDKKEVPHPEKIRLRDWLFELRSSC